MYEATLGRFIQRAPRRVAAERSTYDIPNLEDQSTNEACWRMLIRRSRFRRDGERTRKVSKLRAQS